MIEINEVDESDTDVFGQSTKKKSSDEQQESRKSSWSSINKPPKDSPKSTGRDATSSVSSISSGSNIWASKTTTIVATTTKTKTKREGSLKSSSRSKRDTESSSSSSSDEEARTPRNGKIFSIKYRLLFEYFYNFLLMI